ncbi:hypothetical protein ONE63_010737 [Megalurothrips usitatus]|uniref:Cytochrome P450 4C1-like n=1 Tax=Megalurothrips usitatus TaxID=439358 RepID=A0AAV7XDY1_9NEOP|nr:hypothetical protein ONE63_010737 [Megalurothrips usitatus]
MAPPWVGAAALLPALSLAAAALLAVAMYALSAVRRNLAVARSYPQPRGVPVLGHLLHVLRPREDLFKMVRAFRRDLGSRFSIVCLFTPSFHISDPEAAEVSRNISKGRAYGFLEPWLGRGLLTSTGARWRSRRKLLTPAFHFRVLDQFTHHLEEHARRLVDDLDAAARAASSAAVDVAPIVSRVTLRAICVTAMGKVSFRTDASGQAMDEGPYFEAIHRMGSATVTRMTRPWLWPSVCFKLSALYKDFVRDLGTLHGFTDRVIAERKAKLPDDACDTGADDEDVRPGRARKQPRPFLDSLLGAQGAGADLTDEDIREEVDTFMFEGHDTTSVAVCWALELLARHPDAQARLAAELSALDALDWESVSRLPYLDRVLKECLRLRPSVPFISRYLEADAVLPDGQPTACRRRALHPHALTVFTGKRFATMELKLLLAAVVRRFHIGAAAEDVRVAAEDMFLADLVLRPRAGVRLRLTARA